MAFNKNYIKEINEVLMEKRNNNDIQTTLNIPEHKFKKMSEKFNYALKFVYDKYRNEEIKMFHILLSLQNYFDMQWLVDNILNSDNKKIVYEEMKKEYNIKKPQKKNYARKNKKKKRRNTED